MEGWLTYGELKNITKLLDAFCGSVEPSFRNAYFYYDRALKIYATDGCAKIYLNITKEFLPFDGVASVPIQYLKGIIRDTKLKDDSLVKLTVEDKLISFEIQGITLNSKIEKMDTKQIEVSREFTLLSKKEIGSFLNKLDFVSASANEGDVIDFFTFNDNLIFGYMSNYYKLNSIYGNVREEFHREIPFISARHIVKSLNLLKKSSILEFGIDKKDIVLRMPGIFIKICSSMLSYNKNLLVTQKSFVEEKEINTRELKKVLSKLYVTFSESNIAYLLLNKGNSYIYKENNNSKISFKLPYSFENQYLITIHIRKIRSILSRMSENIIFYLSPKELVLVEKKNEKRASFLVQEFRKLT
ncbi:hypothetical protein X925_06015 [Petrotoga sp. 9T1HF07.CasAA.8.2]|jgi:hypothetical protein|uniref:hypothetical protein n=1 Tax=Petrotoga sp. 9T1HF07.CasAA.8.2 TaxID=1434329 RepID=UPI000CBC10CB|nr:hypothetical protein [Petrotoga sp. 9T1HF07.CasAA.8.2]PNR88485.1 hypothetical protein X925_06015 [Petrotoga sp. 9T1HF07.CasAA.8.2]